MNKEKKILPSGWKEVCLGDVFDFSAGGDVDKDAFSKEKNNEHPYPIYANALTNAGLYGYSSKYKIDKECITITGRGDIGKVFYRNVKYTPIVRLITAIPKENLNAKFLSYAVSKINFFIETTGVSQLTIPQVKPYKMIIPESLEGQEKIAEVLGCADSVIELTASKISKLKLQKKSLMQKLLTPKPHWTEKQLGDICDYKNGGAYESYVLKDGKYSLITLNSIDILGNLKPKHKTINFKTKTLKKNDIIMVLSDIAHGNFLGLTALIPEENKFVLNQRMGLLRVISEDSAYFIRKFLNQNQRYFKRHGQGSSQQNLSKGDILKFLVSIPPLKEQEEIAEVLKTQDAVISLNEQKLQNLKLQKKSLMQKLLTGEWRVK